MRSPHGPCTMRLALGTATIRSRSLYGAGQGLTLALFAGSSYG
jgi:hypothetical protein